MYISDGFRESQRLKGFGYDIGETAVFDTNDLGGTTDIDNYIIYSNATQGEFYQHEMMRFVLVKYRGHITCSQMVYLNIIPRIRR